MEKAVWRNITDTGRKIFSPLKHKAIRYGLSTITGVGLTLYALPIIEHKHEISQLEVDIKCQGSKPVIEVQGDIIVSPGQIYWLVTREIGSRRFRVLEESNGSRWIFFQEYPGFANPRNKYSELPVGPFDFHEGKEYSFSLFTGGLSREKTPLLDQIKYQVKKFIPNCSRTIT